MCISINFWEILSQKKELQAKKPQKVCFFDPLTGFSGVTIRLKKKKPRLLFFEQENSNNYMIRNRGFLIR